VPDIIARFPLTNWKSHPLRPDGDAAGGQRDQSAQRATVKPDDSYVRSEAPAWEGRSHGWGRFQSAVRELHFPRGLRIAAGAEERGGPKVAHGAFQYGGFAAGRKSAGAAELVLIWESEARFGCRPGRGAYRIRLAKRLSRNEEGSRQRRSWAIQQPRLLYDTALFGAVNNVTDERRTIHLGIDLFGSGFRQRRVRALEGVVHALANNTREGLRAGVILRHVRRGP